MDNKKPTALRFFLIAWLVAIGIGLLSGFLVEPVSFITTVPVLLQGPYFSPNGGGQAAIVKALDDTKNDLKIQAYSFTADPIIKAVIEAHKRGVSVIVILDKSHMKEKNGAAKRFKDAGIATFIDAKHAIAHNKLMIIDREYIVMGSYNFTKSAEEKNAENFVILRNFGVAGAYLGNFDVHKAHSVSF